MAERDFPEDETSAFDLEQDFEESAPVASSGTSSDPIARAQAEEARSSRNFKLAIGGGLASVALLCGGLFLTPLGSSHNVLKPTTPSTTSTVSTQQDNSQGKKQGSPSSGPKSAQPSSKTSGSSDDGFWTQPGARQPIEVPAWQQDSYQSLPEAKGKQLIVAAYSDREFSQAANRLPSEAGGYTNDTAKATLADGSPNPMYSYWTAEEYQYETGSYLSRILNPDYGNWRFLQYASNHPNKAFNVQAVEDMFTRSYLVANTGKPYGGWVPFYGDWQENDYGMGDRLLTAGPRWYGEVESSRSTFTYNDALKQYTVTLTAQVKYTAWAQDQSKLEKRGTLTLQFVPNKGAYATPSPHKVLINQATLKVTS